MVLAVGLVLALRTQLGRLARARAGAAPGERHPVGRLELADFRYRGRSLELRGVVLRDPEGEKVIELARAWVAFSPLALLRKQIEIAGGAARAARR